MNDILFLKDILNSEDVTKSINDNLEELFEIIPELSYEVGFSHNHPHHHLDVWHHTLLALSKSENNFIVRMALLLHDIGKPFSYQDDSDEVRHFKYHAEKSTELADNILDRLGFNVEDKKQILYLIKYHDTPITVDDINNNYELVLKRYEVQRCDALAHHPDKLEKRIDYLNKTKEKIKKRGQLN